MPETRFVRVYRNVAVWAGSNVPSDAQLPPINIIDSNSVTIAEMGGDHLEVLQFFIFWILFGGSRWEIETSIDEICWQ